MSLLARSGALFRTLEPAEGALIDGLGVDEEKFQQGALVLHEMESDEKGMPTQFAFHISTEDANREFPLDESPDQWFKQRNLWVYRAETATPSDGLVLHLLEHGRNVDFSQVTMLLPYLASRALPR